MAERTKSAQEPKPKRPRRSRGEGSIYETADGRVRGALLVTDPRTGRDVRRLVTGRSRAEVSRKLAKLKQDAEAGSLPNGATVAEYLARWLDAERVRVRLSTWRQREQYVRTHLTPHLGGLRLARLTPADVERMTTAMVEKGLSPRTAAHARVILRRALGDALRDGIVARNAAALARPPRVGSRSMQAGRDYLEPAQVRQLIDGSLTHPLGPLVALAATTGLRQGELLGLSWSDVDTIGRTLRVRRALARAWVTRDGERVQGWELAEPKTPRSRRTINLPSDAVAALERRRMAQEAEREAAGTMWQDVDGLVFTDALGRPMKAPDLGHGFHASPASRGPALGPVPRAATLRRHGPLGRGRAAADRGRCAGTFDDHDHS